MWTTVFNAGELNYQIDTSFIVPAHNHGTNIFETLRRIESNAATRNELLVIVDSCSDDTESEVLRFAQTLGEDSKTKLLSIFTSSKPLFETQCDNLGFRRARGLYAIEVQADIMIDDPGFDVILIEPMKIWSDLIAVSGRCTHSFALLFEELTASRGSVVIRCKSRTVWLLRRAIGPFVLSVRRRNLKILKKSMGREEEIEKQSLLNQDDTFSSGNAGRLGETVFHDSEFEVRDRQIVYVGQTVNRGPLAFDLTKLSELHFLSEDAFFLAFDEHDLFLRAWISKKWRVCYRQIYFRSPRELGSTRKQRQLRNDLNIAFQSLTRAKAFKKSPLSRLARGNLWVDLPKPEIRRVASG